MKIKTLTIVLLLAMTFSFAQETKTFTKDNYTIDYISTWEASEQESQPAIQFMLFSDVSSQEKDNFRENINLSTEALQGNILSVSEYANKSLDLITAQIPNAVVSVNELIDLNGNKAQKIIWSADFGNGMVLKFKQLILIRGDKGYALTFSSTNTEYDQYVKFADKMMYSFKFIN